MIDTAALGSLAPVISEFRTAHPDITLTIVVEPSVSLTERVANGDLDLAVVVAPNPVIESLGRHLRVASLFDEGIYVYPPESTKRTRRSPPKSSWGPWVTYPAGSQSRAIITEALARRGVPMDVVAESSNPDVLRQMVRLGVGWCALPEEVAESGTRPLTRLPGPPLATRAIAAIRRSDALPNVSADLVFEALVGFDGDETPMSIAER